MSLKQISFANIAPDFIHSIEEHLSGNDEQVVKFKAILDEVFLIAVERGFTNDEFSVLLKFFTKGSISSTNKMKLLPNLVPCTMAPSPAVKQFLAWYFSNNWKKMNRKLSVSILQWLIGLLENDLVESRVIDIFYHDFYNMLHYDELVKYACKLLCKLTKPNDVTASSVYVVNELLFKRKDDKYLLALLSLFKGYKPRLVTEEVKRVDINKILSTVPQKMDMLIKLANRRQKQTMPHRDLGVFEVAITNQAISNHLDGEYKASSLVPFPTFNLEGVDKIASCYPDSIKETLKKFKRVSIPQNIMSLLRDCTGFTLIMFGGMDLQRRFSDSLMQTLQSVFINQDKEASEENQEFFLSRVYDLQNFLNQGIPCVSTFLSGFLLNWDGLVHRPQIMSLLEWATFDSFQELSINILRPLYMLFVSYNVTMKQQIIQTVTALIRNMYVGEIGRVSRQLPHPFLKARAWTDEPIAMLAPLVRWVEDLCKVGMCLEPKSSTLLLQAISFYEMMNLLESRYQLPIWTMMSAGVIYHSLFKVTPVALCRVCRLLLKYHRDYLPQLRTHHPQFYNECQNKISMSSKYVQELINMLWTGQAMTRREDGVVLKQWSEESITNQLKCKVDLDTVMDLTHNSIFLPYFVRERENNGLDFLKQKRDFFIVIEHYLEDITNFIKYFSPVFQTP